MAVASGHNDAATAPDEPPEDPPGTSSLSELLPFHGFTAGPELLVSFEEPIANSSLLSLPKSIIPWSLSFWVIVDSYAGTKFSKILLDAVVLIPAVQNKSFTPIGIPSSDLASPLIIF